MFVGLRCCFPNTKWRRKRELMKLIIEFNSEKHWKNIEDRLSAHNEKFDGIEEDYRKKMEEQFKANHDGRDWFEEKIYQGLKFIF